MIALDPQQTFEVVPEVALACEPANTATVFSCRFGKASLQAQLDDLRDKADAEVDLVKMRALLAEGIGLFVKEVKPAMPTAIRLDRDAVERKGTVLEIPREVDFIGVEDDYRATVAQVVRLRVPALQVIARERLGWPASFVDEATLDELDEAVGKVVRLRKLCTCAASNRLAELDVVDLWDISNQLTNALRLTEIERKKSVLRSASAARRRSAGGAGVVSA